MPSLPHRPDVLFGRQPDLDQLHARTGTAGITAVVGRPQLGKSWLLAEFAHQFASSYPNEDSPLANLDPKERFSE